MKIEFIADLLPMLELYEFKRQSEYEKLFQ
jgi:hypothetical protein